MDHYQGKYRISSARLPGWDYASAGYYFVTIVTQGHIPYFGEIVDGKMHLSPIGAIVADEWTKTPQIRPNVQLDEWVIMPNHIHGIINIIEVETPRRGVSTTVWKPNTLGSILNQFKSVCTKRIRIACNPDFSWQSRFYDHIIRDESSLDRIRTYIRYNPLQWSQDDENPDRTKGRLPRPSTSS